jgi:hypothetical protein
MEQKMTQQEINDLKRKFQGERVSLIDGKGEKWVGQVYFIGYNPYFPSWELQVTLDRTPITNVDPKSIRKLEPIKKLF